MKFPNFVVDSMIRRRAHFERLPIDRYTIRVAHTLEQYESAFRLIHVGYVFEGIESLRPIDLRITEQHVLHEAVVLIAYEDEQPVGTITITGDSPAGLPLDRDYPEGVDRLRHEQARLAELGSFAIVRRCQKTGLAQLLSMAAMRVAFRSFDASHVVIGVHPKATPMYRAIWDFEPIGAAQMHSELRAPVAGHVAERTRTVEHFRRCFPRPMMSGLRAVDHLFMGAPLPCVFMPDDSNEIDITRTDMSREVFRALFVERTNRLESLSACTLHYLRRQRTDETLGAIVPTLRKAG
jgi:hypothetical protein